MIDKNAQNQSGLSDKTKDLGSMGSIDSAKVILLFLENDFEKFYPNDDNILLKNALITAINCLISKGD